MVLFPFLGGKFLGDGRPCPLAFRQGWTRWGQRGGMDPSKIVVPFGEVFHFRRKVSDEGTVKCVNPLWTCCPDSLHYMVFFSLKEGTFYSKTQNFPARILTLKFRCFSFLHKLSLFFIAIYSATRLSLTKWPIGITS